MCTLTYIPTSENTFIWTQNRDESPLLTSPGLIYAPSSTWVYPQEPQSGGTWISITTQGRVVSLLNGAFEQNKYVPSIKSRGIMVLDFLTYSSLATFVKNYDFKDIEPFTMVVHEHNALWEFRWDKSQKYLNKLDALTPHIWSSSTMYPQKIKNLRRTWFEDYLQKHTDPTRSNILDFHNNAGTGDLKNDLVMDRGIVKTVSITSIEKQQKELDMVYYDLINGGMSKATLKVI